MVKELPNKKYATVYIDPPWYERGAGKFKRGADKHYKLLKTDEMIDITNQVLENKIADNAHCYLWVTNNHLPDGLKLMESLGFVYKTNLVWAKTHFGIGRYFRGQHELCLFGVKGRGFAATVKTNLNNVSTLVGKNLLKKRAHSQKPEEMYALIESRSYGPYVELYARDTRINWDVWGEEV